MRGKYFETDPWQLNCPNGTLNLQTLEFDQTKANTFKTEAEYNPAVKCPVWEKTVRRLLPDMETREYFRRAAGYSLTGDISEGCFFIAYGTGSTGKTTVLQTIMNLLGNYGNIAGYGELLKTKSAVLAEFSQCRFITAVPDREKIIFSEEFIATVTGGGKLEGRFKYQDRFIFRPQMKIWFEANVMPQAADYSKALWRRAKTIPFTETIPDKRADPKLIEKLKGEYSGILNWLIEGCNKWRETGLDCPVKLRGSGF